MKRSNSFVNLYFGTIHFPIENKCIFLISRASSFFFVKLYYIPIVINDDIFNPPR